MKNDLSWKCIWAFGPQLLRFCVQSCYNTMPSPNNCVRWKFTDDQSCVLCKAPLCTLPHILSGCNFSLNQRRWNYRHDRVLKVLLDGIEELLQEKRDRKHKSPFPQFVKVGQSSLGRRRGNQSFGLLEKARDWVVMVDIGACKLIFPTEIFSTAERPDIVLYSVKIKTVILIENTSGCDENHAKNHAWKTDKYHDLVEAIKGNNWVCHFFAVEVGARGFNSTHVPFCLKSLGFPPRSVKSLLGKLNRAALEASYHIWLSRNDREWKPPLVDWKTSYRPRSTPALTAPPESQGTSAQSLPLKKVPPAPKDSPSLVTGEEAIDFVITPLFPEGEVEEISKPPISSATPIAKPSGTC